MSYREQRTAHSFGTTRKNPYTGDQLHTERNQYGEPMGSTDPMKTDWATAFPAARSPMAATPRPTGVGPAPGLRTGKLATGGLRTGMLSPTTLVNPPAIPAINPISFPVSAGGNALGSSGASVVGNALRPPAPGVSARGTSAVSSAAPAIATPATAFPSFGAIQKTATGMQSFQPDSQGGRWVGTTSPTLVPRGGGQGVVTNTGASAFDEKGMQNADTTSGPARIYDPRQDASKTFLDASGNVTIPRSGPDGTATSFPGGPALPAGANGTPSARGVMIDPRYQTPGANPIGVISGGTVSQTGRGFPAAAPATTAPSAGNPWPGALTGAPSPSPGSLPSGSVPGAVGAIPRPLGMGDLRLADSRAIPNTNTGFPASAPVSASPGVTPRPGFGDLHVAESRLTAPTPLPPTSFPTANPPMTNDEQAGALVQSLEKGAAMRMARDDEAKRKRTGFPGGLSMMAQGF